jgi:hypothetical protein
MTPNAERLGPNQSDVGILLVHGIGEQNQGDTLLEIGQPLVTWMREWVRGVNSKWISCGLDRGSLRRWLKSLKCVGAEGKASQKLMEGLAGNISPDLQLIAHTHGPMSADCLKRYRVLDSLFKECDANPKDRSHSREANSGSLKPSDIRRIAGREQIAFMAGEVNADEAILRPTGELPAHAKISIDTLDPNGDLKREEWLIAEAHWANSHIPPRAGRVALWSALASPYIITTLILSYMSFLWKVLRGASDELPWLLALLSFVISVIMIPVLPLFTILIQFYLAALSLLILIPIGPLKKVVRPQQKLLATLVGDSYVFVESEVTRAAITGKVLESLEWLSTRCRNTVLIAHSQGAYIALQALEKSMPGNLRLFVTLGSGIRRLSALRASREHSQFWKNLQQFFSLMCCFSYSAGAYDLVSGNGSYLGIALLSASVIYWATMFLLSGESIDDHVSGYWQDLMDHRKVLWLDYAARYDPVSCVPGSRWAGCRQEVTNRGSIIWDHTTYTENREQFLASVVSAICRVCESILPIDRCTSSDGVMLEYGARFRPQRNAFLKLGWWLTVLGCGAVLLKQWGRLEALGEAILDMAGPFVGLLRVIPVSSVSGIGHRLIGGTSIVAFGFASYGCIYIAWRLWDRQDSRVLARRVDHLLTPAAEIMFHYWAAVFCSILSLFAGMMTSIYWSGRLLYWPIASVTAIVFVIVLYEVVRKRRVTLGGIIRRRKELERRLKGKNADDASDRRREDKVRGWLNHNVNALRFDEAIYERISAADHRTKRRHQGAPNNAPTI